MNAEELIRLAGELGFVALFLAVAVRMARAPLMVNALALLFFGIAAALVVTECIVDLWLSEPLDEWVLDLRTALILLFPLSMLLLADAFMSVPRRYIYAASAAQGASMLVVLATREEDVGLLVLVPLAYFLLTQGYASTRFVVAAREAVGVGQKRLLAVSLGSAALVALVALAIPAGILPRYEGLWTSLSGGAGLAAGLAFLAAFAPPRLLKSAWQADEIRLFLTSGPAGTWVAAPSVEDLAREVQEEVRSILGSETSVLWLWDEATGTLVSPATARGDVWPGGADAAAEAYSGNRQLRTRVVPDDPADDRRGIRIMSPVSRGERRWGVISAVGRSAAAFAEDDVWLLAVFADQIAFALEHNELLAQLSEVRAKEEADQLKEDFLSSVAHDLQTPLTTLLGETQLMERRAQQDPSRPAEPLRLRRVIAEAQRMRAMVRDLLDFSRADHASLVNERLPVDVAAIAHEVAALPGSGGRVAVIAPVPAIVLGDEARLLQVFDNLVENALKYSDPEERVQVEVTQNGENICVAVRDHGIGIAPQDVPFVFDRFWRSRSVDDRTYAGIGLGLFICRRIIEEHGGSIAVESGLGVGSTLTLVLPSAPEARAAGAGEETAWRPTTS